MRQPMRTRRRRMAAPLARRRNQPRGRRILPAALIVIAAGAATIFLVPRLFSSPSPAAGAGNGRIDDQLPACRYDDLPATHASLDDWRITLLDTAYALPATYAPDDLVDSSEAQLNAGFPIRSLALPDLRDLVAAARDADVELGVVSAFRSYDQQEETFAQWEADVGHEQALQTSARPGHSEHQLGTAVDFSNARLWAPWDGDDWASTRQGAWLASNAWRYGFVMSYPAGARDMTCYDYEPWHYRYVGHELAAQVHTDGRSLRELLWEQQAPAPAGR